MANTEVAVLNGASLYPLHKLGWKAFQDLCIAVAEECLQRPVQSFLPTNDAGRDGAFVGSWTQGPGAGSSTIQCKFTSNPDINLSLSLLDDELEKAKALAVKELAHDYVIMTNHPVTGQSELVIKAAFEAVGVGTCRVFHGPWISAEIKARPRLRMLVPRLYGLGDLSDLLDARAYDQAQLILSEMGDNLQKLVVTEAHRKAVRAIRDYNLVLLLGSPASGKSTIGASLAIGAADTWNCATIKSTSPEHLQLHLNPSEPQFFWIDDAWGSTQYQGDRTEAWNQVFPLMQAALNKGTRFLITSRDYIWWAAKRDLKLQSLPVLTKSQVIIDVHRLSVEEKARILYNHLKLGDQTTDLIRTLKPYLPSIAQRNDFLPESARRLGNQFFTEKLITNLPGVTDFFSRPKDFLRETIENLSAASKAAIALVFLNGGKVRSPVSTNSLQPAASAFGIPTASLRDQLEALNGSILLLPQDEEGPYWTYKHPTVSDAFAAYVAESPELIEVYLAGAAPGSIVGEVVCAGVKLAGAPVVVPNNLHGLLVERIASLPSHILKNFIIYRANPTCTQAILAARPDLIEKITWLSPPLREDQDATFYAALHEHGLLSEERRLWFVGQVRDGIANAADASFIEESYIEALLTKDERDDLLLLARTEIIDNFSTHVSRYREDWDSDNDPSDHFYRLMNDFEAVAREIYTDEEYSAATSKAESRIRDEVSDMEDRYHPPKTTEIQSPSEVKKSTSLDDIFRDIDE